MAEPVNTKRREVLVDVSKKHLDIKAWLKVKQGSTNSDGPNASKDAKSGSINRFGTDCDEGTQEMDLSKVDNDNRLSYNGDEIPKKEPTMKNIDFGKLHDDFAATVISKKKAGAGE